MHDKTLAAYTPPTAPYPPYVNISADDADGSVAITVRGPPRPGEFSDQDCGPTARIILSAEEWNALRGKLAAEAEARADRAIRSLKALQDGAALAMAALPEEGTVADFLAAIHREAVRGQLASDEVTNECAPNESK